MKTVYDLTVKDRKGNDVSLSEYKGKVLLIVNTATGCGFTPHYEPLEAMYKDLRRFFEMSEVRERAKVVKNGLLELRSRIRQGSKMSFT